MTDGFGVDVEAVRATIKPLSDALTTANEVWRHHERMVDQIDGWPGDWLEGKVKIFLRQWGHAMGEVVTSGEAVGQALAGIVLQYELNEEVQARRMKVVRDEASGTERYVPIEGPWAPRGPAGPAGDLTNQPLDLSIPPGQQSAPVAADPLRPGRF